MRRLPVYLLLDTSGSMRGEPIEAVNVGLQAMLSTLRQDPQALESVCLSVITFDRDVKVLIPLTPLQEFVLPKLETPESGPTHLGQALDDLCLQVDREVRRNSKDSKGDWKPLLFVMTDGRPSDKLRFKEAIPKVQQRGFGSIIACAAGSSARAEDLKELTPNVVSLETLDGHSFTAFFKWVTDTVAAGSASMGATAVAPLPPPPPEVQTFL